MNTGSNASRPLRIRVKGQIGLILTSAAVAACYVACSGAAGSTTTGPSTTTGSSPTRILALSGDLAFGNVRVLDVSPPRTLTITNNGNATLTVTSIRFTESTPNCLMARVFPTATAPAQTFSSGLLAPGASQQIQLLFWPQSAMTCSGLIVIESDQTSGTNTIAISGTGIETTIAPVSNPCASLSIAPTARSSPPQGEVGAFVTIIAAANCNWDTQSSTVWVAPSIFVGGLLAAVRVVAMARCALLSLRTLALRVKRSWTSATDRFVSDSRSVNLKDAHLQSRRRRFKSAPMEATYGHGSTEQRLCDCSMDRCEQRFVHCRQLQRRLGDCNVDDAANSGAPRTGTLTIAGQLVNVIQSEIATPARLPPSNKLETQLQSLAQQAQQACAPFFNTSEAFAIPPGSVASRPIPAKAYWYRLLTITAAASVCRGASGPADFSLCSAAEVLPTIRELCVP